MIKQIVHRITTDGKNSVKGPIEDLLKARADSEDKAISETGLTLGEIGRAIGLDKTRHGDIAAALNKLRNEGNLKIDTGPRTFATGPRYVKRYRWNKKTKPSAAPSDDRRFLSFAR